MSSSQKVVTPVGILSYVNVFRPRAYQDSDVAKYSCAIIFNKSDEAALAPIRAAYNEVLQEDFEGTLPYGAKGGDYLMDGAVRYPGDDFYKDKLILNASQSDERPPQVMMRQAGSNEPVPALQPSDVYSGAKGQLLINFYGYQGGTKGIAASLQAVLKTEDGESLGGDVMSAAAAAAAFAGGAGGSASAPVAGAPIYTMNASANGLSREDYQKAGWTDDQLVAAGHLTITQPAPAPVPAPAPAPAPSAPVPAPAASGPVYTMNASANGLSREDYQKAGWTDDQLVAAGHLTITQPAPSAPAPSAPAPSAPAPAPSAPAPAPAPAPSAPAPAPAPAGPTMTALANGLSHDDYIKAGWTDEQLISGGYMTV